MWVCLVCHVSGGRGAGMMCDHGNSWVFYLKKNKTFIQWGFKAVITFQATWKMMSRAAKLLKAFIPAKMPLRAYPDQHTSHEGSDAHVLAQRGLSLSHTRTNAVTTSIWKTTRQTLKYCTSGDASGCRLESLDQTPHEYLVMPPQNKDLASNGSGTIT